MTRILVLDNYDSFVYNLVQYVGQLGAECLVSRNDELTTGEALDEPVDGILISPGPGTPESAGICIELVCAAAEVGRPVLGVCLGHQAIGAAYGGAVVRADVLLHGKTSEVSHAGAGVLAGLPEPFTATRYHSLVLAEASLPAELEVTARTADGTVMALRHRKLPLEGVQFHPESVLTQGGHRLLANWLAVCGDPTAVSRSEALVARVDERRAAAG
jgi:para-aminobenzoate synthetase component II